MGEREKNREEIRDSEFQRAVEHLDFLGDPFDQMDLHTKRQHALSLYYQIIKVRKYQNIRLKIFCT